MMRVTRKNILNALIILLCLQVFGASAVFAATINITTTADSILNDGLTSLREAVTLASSNNENDTIVLLAGQNHLIDFCAAGTLQHAENFDLIINGNNASVQNICTGTGTFEITGTGALTIQDLDMTGFISGGGGFVDGAAVRSDGAMITLINTDISGFEAGTGIIVSGGFGTDLVITDSSIVNNVGIGLVSSFAPLNMTGSTVSGNTGRGVALVDGSPVQISDSFIQNNGSIGLRSTGQGSTSMTLSNTEVTGNGDLGVACSACGTVEITDSIISNNGGDSAGVFGGGGLAVTWDIDDPADAPTVTVTGTSIENNQATRNGGGVRITILESVEPTATPGLLTIDSSSISGNSTDGFFDISGGGIYAETGSIVIRNGSTLSNNRAGPLGGSTSATGGAIHHLEQQGEFVQLSSLSVSDTLISGNQANNSGGGIYVVLEGSVDITDSRLIGNNSNSGSGGGIRVSGADVNLLRTTVNDNHADTFVGGGIALIEFSGYPEGSLTITESTISNNSANFAASGGGGVFVNVGDAGADAALVNSTVSDNDSPNLGGGIMVMQTSRLSLTHTTVTRNTGVNGANVFVAAGDFNIAASVINDPSGGNNCHFFSAVTISDGYSLAGDTSCNLGVTDVIDGAFGLLGPLADNGGPTFTHLPGVATPIAGLVPAAECTLETDQRGQPRPQGINCDAGAVEIVEIDVPNSVIVSPAANATVSLPTILSGTATAPDGVVQVLFAIKDTVTDLWWDGSGWGPWQLLQATVDQPGSYYTGWMYNFDSTGTGGSGEYRIHTRTEDANAVIEDPSTQQNFFTDEALALLAIIDSPTLDEVLDLPVVISGTATSPAGVETMLVGIRDQITRLWWNGRDWGPWQLNPVTESPANGQIVNWQYRFDTGEAEGSGFYRVYVRARDQDGDVSPSAQQSFETTLQAPFSTEIINPVRDENVSLPYVLNGTATAPAGISTVLLGIRDADSMLWWNGSGWGGWTLFPVNTVLSDANNGAWSYLFDPTGSVNSGRFRAYTKVEDINGARSDSVQESFTGSLVEPE